MTRLAKVQTWNSSTVEVLCPFCGRNHRHGFAGYMGQQFRASHCMFGTGETTHYQFAFPFDVKAGEVWFFVDKRNAVYRRIGAQEQPQTGYVAPRNPGLSQSERPRMDDGNETYAGDGSDQNFRKLCEYLGMDPESETYECPRIVKAVSSMVTGDEAFVTEYLKSSKETHIFLRGVDHKGDTALHLAAVECYPGIVRLVLENGADVDAVNSVGRTPLMEASLWGRVENVIVLLEYGADARSRDQDGCGAIDFARPARKNDEERHSRFDDVAEKLGIRGFNTRESTNARYQIVDLLKDHLEQQSQRETPILVHDQIADFRFVCSQEDNSIRLVKLFPVQYMTKTIARLIVQSGKYHFPPVDAMSGGADSEEFTIRGKCWTNEVMDLANNIGYTLPRHSFDRDRTGQYFACHAEKQLAAYFVQNHVVLNVDDEKLKDSMPPVTLEEAAIIISRSPCEDCYAFFGHLKEKLALSFQLHKC